MEKSSFFSLLFLKYKEKTLLKVTTYNKLLCKIAVMLSTIRHKKCHLSLKCYPIVNCEKDSFVLPLLLFVSGLGMLAHLLVSIPILCRRERGFSKY